MDIEVGGKIPISLPDDICGIVGLRSWNVKNNSRYVNSIVASHEWTAAVQKGPKPANLPGEHGFYAFRLTSDLDPACFYSTLETSTTFPNTIIRVHGLVELRGRVIEHEDGVIRGEWCRILCFFLPVPPSTNFERKVYGAPLNDFEPVDMKTEIAESEWLESILGLYHVPVYITEPERFAAVYRKLVEYDAGRDVQSRGGHR